MRKFHYAEHDFSPASLPLTRKQLFFDVYKNNPKTIFKGGLALLLSSLPFVLFEIFMYLGYMGISEEHYGDQVKLMRLVWNSANGVGSLLFFVPVYLCLVSILRVYRALLWQEGLEFRYEFVHGLKENFRSTWLASFLLGLLFALAYASSLIFAGSILAYGPLLFFALIFLPIYLWMLLLSNVYEGGFWLTLKNACFFFGKSIGFSLLGLLMILWPFFVDFLPLSVSPLYISIKYSVLLLLLLFYYPAVILLALLYSFSKFDKEINCSTYPEYFRKGLFDLNSPIVYSNIKKKGEKNEEI